MGGIFKITGCPNICRLFSPCQNISGGKISPRIQSVLNCGPASPRTDHSRWKTWPHDSFHSCGLSILLHIPRSLSWQRSPWLLGNDGLLRCQENSILHVNMSEPWIRKELSWPTRSAPQRMVHLPECFLSLLILIWETTTQIQDVVGAPSSLYSPSRVAHLLETGVFKWWMIIATEGSSLGSDRRPSQVVKRPWGWFW